MPPLVWLITGCSSGFGHELTLQALNRGDKVIATARDAPKLTALQAAGAVTLALDVTSPLATLKEVAKTANDQYGRIDILFNNAGMRAPKTINSEAETQTMFTTNVFGAMNMARAIAPLHARPTHSGTIANMPSVGAWCGGPGISLYGAVNWATSGISEALTAELAPFGIKVIAIEPGSFRTAFLKPLTAVAKSPNTIEEYEGTAAREYVDFLNIADNS
ncbi:hypothetical protein FQN55_006554 [Onygenales sp. PD_40]|nr:hypothetical protein FQN55_006554 [Onygenales sp. PD_40]KAK2784790.1 hypothetical protein FQN52_008875 [Onygenales sp. PD_12]